jgi:isoleucyl-tRNA synthetase
MSIDFPKSEETVLERWREIKAFERQVSKPSFGTSRED